MDQTTLLYIMAGAVTVSAIALAIQAAMLFGMYKATVTLRDRVFEVLPHVEKLMDTSQAAIEEARETLAEVRQKSNAILDSGQRQIGHLESFLANASERTSKQLAYAEAVVEDALGRVEDTVALVHRGVLKPIRSINGLAAGVSAAIQYLMRKRPDLQRATLDEEMYI